MAGSSVHASNNGTAISSSCHLHRLSLLCTSLIPSLTQSTLFATDQFAITAHHITSANYSHSAMADDTAPKQPNGVVIDPPNGDEHSQNPQDLTLLTILNRLIAAIFFPSPNSSAPLLHRIKTALAENVPLLRDASKNTAARVLEWTRRGSPLRALLVVSVSPLLLFDWICWKTNSNFLRYNFMF